MLGIHGLEASLALIETIGITHIASKILEKTRYLINIIQESHYLELVSPLDDSRRAGIVTARPRAGTAEGLFTYLHEHGVQCALRGGGVRFSPHFYTPRDQLDALARMFADYPRAVSGT